MYPTIKPKEQNLTKVNSKEIYIDIIGQLCAVYNEQEARSLAKHVLKYQLGSTAVDLITEKEFMIPVQQWKDTQRVIERLKSCEPLQYIYGETDFYGRTFMVNPFVLIPRPETEELVHLIINENLISGLKIFDIGTGSGCISVTLAKELRNPKVYALDIDKNALQVASKNAMNHRAPVNFLHLNILEHLLPVSELDIIVSNPPYVREKEKANMHDNVLSYEPAKALFVPDEDPLLFYRRITHLANRHLKRGGKLYFEINEAFGNEVVGLLDAYNFIDVALIKDLQGKDRIVKGTLK
jgi:release factor glutamine methyltransferase